MKTAFADNAWLSDGWHRDVHLALDAQGRFTRVQAGAADMQAPRLGRWVLPGVPNLHSHAFQRAMAGLAERQTHPQDSFWTWREVMYGFAAKFGPQALRDVAAMLYAEMLESGYTSVCEFHYLHHAPDGRPYDDPAEMSMALIEAARDTGIGLTLLPTLYMTGGFDGRPLGERQRRFGHDVDGYLRLVDRLRAHQATVLEEGRLQVGLCFHSLRAVPEAAMQEVLTATRATTMPVHIHIAEQIGEVQDCLAVRDARPVEWLLDRMPVDFRWTLVHATHLTDEETRGIAARGATVAICTTTEANLGDGLFPLRTFLEAGGQWGVGSDSHISVSPVEELRWLEYGQRLVSRRRNIAVLPHLTSTGECLYAHALAGGARGTMQPVGWFEAGDATAPGTRADFLVLDDEAPELTGALADNTLDRWIFSGNRNLVRDVYVGGRQVVSAGRHRDRDAIAARYRRTLQGLLAD
ncbi:formimidoylglutamate deiminase [Agrilutibacter solisilvae]|nr:formimidoylglutamate deiminase [Lysobacter solisilvae]